MSQKSEKNISIIIPCYKDMNIMNLLKILSEDSQSINREYLAIIVKEEYENIVKKIGDLKINNVRIFFTEKGNLSKSFNIGIKNARYSKILLLNSDILKISKNYLENMLRLTREFKIVKSNIVFNHTNVISKIISNSRRLGHVGVAYNPGLLIDTTVFKKIGLFNEKIKFAEDDDFSRRLSMGGINFKYNQEACIWHPPISLTHDLIMAFRIGQGRFQSVKHGNSFDDEYILNILKRVITLRTFRIFVQKARTWGSLTAIYDILWAIFFYIGNYKERIVNG